MALPDGARTKRIPALSWDSVVESPDQPHSVHDTAVEDFDSLLDDPITLEPLSLDLIVDATSDAPVSAVRFEPLAVDAAAVFSSAPSTPPSVAHPAPAPVSTPTPEADNPPAGTISTAVVDEPLTIRTTPPAVVVPAIGDVTSGPDRIDAPVVLEREPVSAALPEIHEASPVESVSPLLPSVPIPVRPASPTPFPFDPASVAPAPTPQPRRRKKRGAVKLVASFVVLGGIVAAGVVIGQDRLFPREWDATTAPYAEAVEAASDAQFTEPLSIISEPTAAFATRLQTQLASVSPEELAQWRALGLASGQVDDATLAQQLSGWQDAVYSTLDGQVYHDASAAGASLDAQLVQEMATAMLDQQFGWSSDQPERSLDAAAATSAEVLRQARVVQEATDFAGPVPSVPSEVADTVPPVIGYRILAPHVYAEFDAAIVAGDRTNPLSDLETGGPGTVGSDEAIAAPGPTVASGEETTTSPVAKDRAFWYLVFAGYLDQRTAYVASEAVVESAVTGVARGATQCVAATFSGSGVDQTSSLRSALTAWSAAVPVEMASSFQVLADGTMQLISCDPGIGFAASPRPSVARELISWRMAELATLSAVRVGGGGAAEFTDAWTFVQASPVATDLMSLSPASTPAEMAAAAQEAVNLLFMPVS